MDKPLEWSRISSNMEAYRAFVFNTAERKGYDKSGRIWSQLLQTAKNILSVHVILQNVEYLNVEMNFQGICSGRRDFVV